MINAITETQLQNIYEILKNTVLYSERWWLYVELKLKILHAQNWNKLSF